MTEKLSDSDGSFLVKIARKAVTEFLSNGNKIKLDADNEKKFSFNSGVFVTLNKHQELRGCIGFPMPDKKLSHAIIDGAIAASTQDPRFQPVKSKELDDIILNNINQKVATMLQSSKSYSGYLKKVQDRKMDPFEAADKISKSIIK